jgi:hypothetical protein
MTTYKFETSNFILMVGFQMLCVYILATIFLFGEPNRAVALITNAGATVKNAIQNTAK